jgi:hypothetical protein
MDDGLDEINATAGAIEAIREFWAGEQTFGYYRLGEVARMRDGVQRMDEALRRLDELGVLAILARHRAPIPRESELARAARRKARQQEAS